MLHSLRVYPAFRLLMAGTLATNSAFWMYLVAVGWLALQLLDSPLFVGLTGFASGIPLLLFSLPAGVVIDRRDRRLVLLAAQIAVMILAAAFAVLVASGTIRPWSVLVLVFGYGTAMSFIFPTRTTIVTALVDRPDLVNALALNAAVQNATRITGPAIAGVLIAVVGIAPTFAVAALLQIVALATTFRLPAHTPVPSSAALSARASLTVGLRAVAGDPFLLRLMLLALVTNVLVMPYINLMPVFARDVLHVGSAGLGLLLASTGLGTVIGALWVAHSHQLADRHGIHTATAGAFAMLVLGFAAIPLVSSAVFFLLAAGITSAAFLALTQTSLQLRAEDAIRGRVLSVYLMTWGLLPIGQLAVGALAERRGAPLAQATACIIALAGIGYLSWRMPVPRPQ